MVTCNTFGVPQRCPSLCWLEEWDGGGGKGRHSPQRVRAAHPGTRAEVPGAEGPGVDFERQLGKGKKRLPERHLAFTG